MLCYDINCPIMINMICPKYPMEYMQLVTRRGYCPVIDQYDDAEKQEAYEKSKKGAEKERVGQQRHAKKTTSEDGAFIRRKK